MSLSSGKEDCANLQYLTAKLSLYSLQPYNIDSLRIASNASNIDLLCVQCILERAHNYWLFVKTSLHEILIEYLFVFIVFSTKCCGTLYL